MCSLFISLTFTLKPENSFRNRVSSSTSNGMWQHSAVHSLQQVTFGSVLFRRGATLLGKDNEVYIPFYYFASYSASTGCGLDGRDLIPGRGKIFLFSTARTPALGPTQPPGFKRQEHKADNSPLFSAEIKNGVTIPPLSHTSSWCGA
jgi:hypothetical protein